MSQLKEVVVCITGASSGIGEALAYAFAKQGAKLILCARNVEKLEQVSANCGAAAEVIIHPIDLSDYKDIETSFTPVLNRVGHIDILINNAGISQRATVAESTIAVDEKIMNLNYFGVVALTRLILPTMMQRRSGHMVVISSVAGYVSTSHRSAYAASKHAVRAWFDSLRSEVFKLNIHVTVICPGYINTDISKHALNETASNYGKMDENQAKGMSAEECANKIVKAIEQQKSELIIGGAETKAILLKRFLPSVLEKKLRTIIPN